MEEGQRYLAGIVMGVNPVWHRPVAARRRLVAVDAHVERDDRALGRTGNARTVAAVDDGVRQHEQKVAGTRHAIPKNSWVFGVKCQARIEVLPPVEVKGMAMEDLETLKARVRGEISAAFERLGKWKPTLDDEDSVESEVPRAAAPAAIEASPPV